jgi:hypothetical protein
MWLLVDRSPDDPFLEIRRHLREEVCGYQFYFSGKTSCSKGAVHRKTVDRIHIKSSQCRKTTKKIKRLLETLVFVPFDKLDDLPARAVLRKCFRKAIRFPAMISGVQHASNDGHFGAPRNRLPHQLPGKTTI